MAEPKTGVAWRPSPNELRIQAELEAAQERLKGAGPRRIEGPQLIHSSIVSVQPMTGPVGGTAFYRSRCWGVDNEDKPAGCETWFKVSSIAMILKLFTYTNGALHGATAPNARGIATILGDSFGIVDGQGRVQPGTYKVEGLSSNEAYERFLLNLVWGAPHMGWISPLHVLAISAEDGIDAVYSVEGMSGANQS